MSIEQLVNLATQETTIEKTWRPNTRRVQLDLKTEQYARLLSLKEKTMAVDGTFTAVVDTALRLYEMLIDLKAEGSEFFIKEADGTIINTRSLFE